MKTTPPAVVIGPPRFGEPHSGLNLSAKFSGHEGRHRPERHLPEAAASLQIDGHQRSEGRRRAGEFRRREQHAPTHDVRCAAHEVVFVLLAEPLFRRSRLLKIEALARDELHDGRDSVDLKGAEIRFRILATLRNVEEPIRGGCIE